MININGCEAITGSNWKQVKWVGICERKDKTGAITVLNLVAANLKADSIVYCYCALSHIWDARFYIK